MKCFNIYCFVQARIPLASSMGRPMTGAVQVRVIKDSALYIT